LGGLHPCLHARRQIGGSDNKIHQWDIATGKQIRSWDYFERNQPRTYASGFAEKTADLKAISPDGKTALWLVNHWTDEKNSVGVDSWQFMIWDMTTGKDRCPLTAKDDRDYFGKVVLSPDGKYLTAYTRNGEMIVWDAATGNKLKTLGRGGSVEAVAYSPDSRRVAAITRGYSLSVWDLATGKELWNHEISWWYAPGWDKSLAFSPDGKTLAVAHWKNVRIWEVESGKERPVLEGHRWPVRSLAFSPKDGALISADDACVCEWNKVARQKSRHSLIAYHGASRSVAESYELKLRIYQPEGRPLQLRELISDKVLGEFAEVKPAYYHGCFSTDGRTVALFRGDKKKELIFLDVPARKVRSRLTTDKPISENLALSGDGKMLAVSCSDQTVVLIDSFRGQIVRRLGTPHAPPKENEPRIEFTRGWFSPDGRLVAFGTHVYRPHDRFGPVNLDYLPKDTPGIRVWQVATGRELRQFENCMADAPYSRIKSLRFSPDNKSLAVALRFYVWRSGDRERDAVPVLEVVSGQLRRRFKGHTDHVASIAFSPDGKILASGSEDTTILLWDMNRPVGTKPSAKKPAPERLRLLWSNLADRDAARAYDAVLALADMPGPCVPFLAERLKPVEPPPDEQLARLIADLDADSFEVRKEASAQLAELHELARPALKKALSGKVSPEVRRRIGRIIDQLDAMKYSPALMRELRAVEVLERVATKEARRHLELLATGAPEAILTSEAKASLGRLKPPG
jgi:WD40 repeat protein